jgi:glycosyltransferase involved in cell wall biosynthesis
MLKKWIESLPFIHHQPPLNLPLRKAVVMSLQRPVNLLEIQKFLQKQFQKDGDKVVEDVIFAIEYLRKARIGKTDAANLFTASLRSLYDWNTTLAVDFGLDFISSLPDKRAIISLVTFLNRLGRTNESLQLLSKVRRNSGLNKKKNSIVKSLYFKNKIRLPNESPFLFEITDNLELSDEPLFFYCPLEKIVSNDFNQDTVQLELRGELEIKPEESSSAVAAIFEFYDESDQRLDFARISGLTLSKNVGWYSYLRQDPTSGQFNISFDIDPIVDKIHLAFRTWHAKTPVALKPHVDLKSSSLNEIWLEYEHFLNEITFSNCKELVFIFSGTTHLQDIKANRPIRLAKEFLKKGVAVIFSYHRWKKNEPIPEYSGGLLFQIPVDITIQMLSRIMEIKGIDRKMFMISYPHPSIPKIMNRYKINSWLCVYDARDDWDEFEKVGQAKWYSAFNEKYIVSNSDFVTAVSTELCEKLDYYEPTKPVILSRNALDEDFLSKRYKKKKTSEVIIGYFGHLTGSWFDWKSLILIAEECSKYRFEIIGHSSPVDLVLPSNIQLLGPKNSIEINDIASRWKVGIIPFKINKLSAAVDPIKIYEYLALGLPVVSFFMPQIKDYPNTSLANSVEEFVKELNSIVQSNKDYTDLDDWLVQNTWKDRVNQYRELMDKDLSNNPFRGGV